MDDDFSDDKKGEKQPEEDEEEFLDIQESIREMKRELRREMRDLRDDLSEIREDIMPEHRTERVRRARSPRKPRRGRSVRIGEEDWGDHFGSSIEHYIGSILESVWDSIDRSVGSIFQASPSRRSRLRSRRRKASESVPEEELEDFYDKGAAIMGALSDQTRLKMLKELEKEPLRQSDLSERTNTKGGNFKHHITILKDEGLVRQEGVRERYMLTFAGREALKLAEFLYFRAKKRIPIPVTSSDEEDFPEEEE